jgi:flagellar hook assembly protein FlgD
LVCNRYRELNNDLDLWVSVLDTTDIEDNTSKIIEGPISIIAYPNPANMTWKIKIVCPEINGRIEVNIFDMLGRRVRDMGSYENRKEINLIWDGKNDDGKKVTSASYLLSVRNGERLLGTKKLLMIK